MSEEQEECDPDQEEGEQQVEQQQRVPNASPASPSPRAYGDEDDEFYNDSAALAQIEDSEDHWEQKIFLGERFVGWDKNIERKYRILFAKCLKNS